jgi:hypothetical protein
LLLALFALGESKTVRKFMPVPFGRWLDAAR